MSKNKPSAGADPQKAGETDPKPSAATVNADDAGGETVTDPKPDPELPEDKPNADPDPDDIDDEDAPPAFGVTRTYDLKAPDGTCSVGVDDVTVKVPKNGIVRGVPHDIAQRLINGHGFTAIDPE